LKQSFFLIVSIFASSSLYTLLFVSLDCSKFNKEQILSFSSVQLQSHRACIDICKVGAVGAAAKFVRLGLFLMLTYFDDVGPDAVDAVDIVDDVDICCGYH
jgi:hypothetical protein